MTQDVQQLFEKTKGQLFFRKGAGFLGSLLAKLNVVFTDQTPNGQPVPTACISATTLYWNPEFFLSLDKETRVTVLAHELWHNALLHGARMNERCPDKWNQAGDHVINLWLKAHGYFMGGFPYLMDPKYTDWSTDQVYDDLDLDGGGGQPCPMPGMDGDGYPLGGDVMAFGADEVAKAVGNVVGAKAVAAMSKEAGSIPGEVQITIDQFLSPKLPWNVLLFNYFNELVNDEYSFARPNRRFEDPLMRGMTGRNGLEHLLYAVDVSGSVTDEQVLRMNSEVKFIHEELGPEKLSLVLFDTKVRKTYEFERDETFEKIVVTGRGGTDLQDLYAYARKQGPTAMVVFTDLYVDIPENPGIPIIWVCVDNPQARVPYGQLVHFSEDTGARLQGHHSPATSQLDSKPQTHPE